MVPLSANRPGEPPAADQSNIISASTRALSRLPAASKCGSASSNAPSVVADIGVNDYIYDVGLTFIEKFPNIVLEIWVSCGAWPMFR